MKGKLTKLVAVAAAAVLTLSLTGMLAACGGKDNKVVVTGSTSVQPLMKELRTAFLEKNKDVTVEIGGSGSSQGISDTEKGACDIGMISRALKDSEKSSFDGTKLCDDGIAVIVNKDSELENVTSEQVYNLYASNEAIGGITVAIHREEGSGTRDGFCELIENAEGKSLKKFAEEGGTFDNAETSNSTNVVMTTVAGATNKLGYVSLGSLNDTVKALKLDGAAPSVATVKDGSYKLQRPFVLVLKKGTELKGAAKRFWDFVFGEEGQAIVSAKGYIAL